MGFEEMLQVGLNIIGFAILIRGIFVLWVSSANYIKKWKNARKKHIGK